MNHDQNAAMALRGISAADWARFGLQQIAYVKPVRLHGQPAIAIHAADGTPMGAAPNLHAAVAAIQDHDMEAVLVQ